MQLEEQVKQIVARQLGVELSSVHDGAAFIDDLGADSLSIVELVLAFEEKFQVQIPETATERLRTVGDAVSYIQTLSAQ